MILVRIRCKVPRCRRVLATVEGAPDDWSGQLRFKPCPKHSGAPRNGTFARWVRRQYSAGRIAPFDLPVWTLVPWEELRPAIERAQRTGTPVEETV